MNKAVLFLFSILFIVSSCGNDETLGVLVPGDSTNTNTEKTIMVYMPWSAGRTSNSGSLYRAFQQNIVDMEVAIRNNGGLQNNRLLVFICTTSSSAVFYEIKYEKGTIRHDTLQRYNATNIPAYTTASGLSMIFNLYRNTAPANKYSLIVGCHGTGWIPKENLVYPLRSATRAFGGSEVATLTDITTLAEALNNVQMKTDYILFDDCYMANVEMAYELRGVTDYLIGCTSEIMAYGMPYGRIFGYLSSSNPNYEQIVDEFHNFYSTYFYPYGAIGVIACQYAEDMAGVMKRINNRYTWNTANNSLIQKLDGYSPTIFFDMGSYVSLFCSDNTLSVEFQDVLAKLVPYKAATSQIYSALNYGYRLINVNTFSGITISDPTLNTTINNAAEAKRYTSWWIATH